MGWEASDDIKCQAEDGLRVSNIKIRNIFCGLLRQISQNLWVTVCAFKWFELFFEN